MQGQILGISGATGAITGDDGKRYSFPRTEWKSERDPRAGERVDFVETSDGTAGEIYPLKAGAVAPDIGAVFQSGSDGLSRLASSDGAQGLIEKVKASPALVIAIIVLFVCLFLPYLAISLMSQEESTSLLGYVFGGTSELRDLADFARNRAENTWLMSESNRETLRSVANSFDFTATLGYSLLLVPIGACWTIYRVFKGQSTRRSELLTVAGIGWALFYFIGTEGMLVGEVERLNGFISAEAIREGWSLGFGGYVLLLLGAATIANMMGRFKPKATSD